MRIHRLLLVTLMTATAVALVACGDDGPGKLSEEKVYTLKGNGFSVKIPGKPERKVIAAETSEGAVPVITYISTGDPDGISLSVLRVPEKVKPDLDAAMKGIATNVKGTLTNHTKTTYQGFDSRDAVIRNARGDDGDKGTVFARVILAKGRVYQLQYATEGTATAAPVFRRFAASLRIE